MCTVYSDVEYQHWGEYTTWKLKSHIGKYNSYLLRFMIRNMEKLKISLIAYIFEDFRFEIMDAL